MAEEKAGEAGAEKGTPAQAPEKARDEEAEVVSVELLAPAGWKKKFMLNEDGSPRRNEIIFISPTGEEIKSKRQLQQYLKSHPGGPPSSEFDWGTGDTPRRSARIRERAKAVEMETPEDEKPKKRERKSSSKKSAKEKKDDGDGADKTAGTKEDVTDEEAKAPADVEMKEADDGNKVKDEGVPAEPAAKEDAAEKVEGAGEQVSVLKTDESVQENADAGLENNNAAAAAAAAAAAPGAEFAISVPETEKDKADAKAAENAPSSGESKEAPAKNSIHREENQDDAAVMKEVPSANRSDGQHLPKPSPVNC